MIKLFIYTIIQQASYTLLTRSRNSNSLLNHTLASVISSVVYVGLLKQLVLNFENTNTIIVFVIASTIGSVGMHYLLIKFIKTKPK